MGDEASLPSTPFDKAVIKLDQKANSNIIQLLSIMEDTPQSQVVFAPNPYTPHGKAVFLAGSIDKPPATWQSRVTNSVSHLPITVLNPHRLDWDSTWKQDISDDRFREQVTWEINMMEAADVIALYFGPETQAPISLLELGLFARSGKMIVACPEGFWRRGNVQVVCARFGIELVDSLDKLIEGVVKRLE